MTTLYVVEDNFVVEGSIQDIGRVASEILPVVKNME